MGRPSKLSVAKWAELAARLDAGERATDLAKEYGVSDTAISRRVAQVSQRVSQVAEVVAEAHRELEALPLAQQHRAMTLAEKMLKVSENLADAAALGSDTAHKLQRLANAEAGRIKLDEAGAVESLKRVAALSKTANDASSIAMGLINAKRLKEQEDDAPEVPTVIELVGVEAHPEE